MQVKNIQRVFLSLLGVLMSLSLVQAQTWRSLNGPLESDVRDIVIKNDTVYVVAWDAGGIFKKAVGTSQWNYSEIAEGEGAYRKVILGLLSLNVDNDGSYYAGGEGIVNLGDGQAYEHFFKSNDYGKTWMEFRDGIEYDHTVKDIFITSEDSVLIGSRGGIFRLAKEKNRFERVGGNAWVFIFHQHHDTLIAGTREGIEYSADEGATWTEAGADTLEVYGITFAGDQFFFGSNRGLYKAETLDQSLTVIEGLTSNKVNTLFTFQDKVIAGTDKGTFLISPDDSEVQPVFPEFEGKRVNVIDGFEESLYLGTESGFYSCNFEESACQLDGVPNSRIRAMTIQNSDTLLASTSSKIQRYFTSSSRWDSLSIPIERARSMLPISEDSILTISRRYFLSCSFEHGACDSTRFTGSGTSLFDLKKNTAGNLFITSREHVFKSTDKGENWEVIYTSPESINFSLATFSDSLLFINSDKIRYDLATNTYDTLSKTVNLITQNGTLYSHGNGIHKSTDFGETWTTILQDSDMINAGLDLWKTLLYDESAGKLYAITTEGRIYVTKNGGGNWGVETGMYRVYMESAAIGPEGTLYLGTSSGGVFANTKTLDPPITISNEEEPNSSAPKSFKLHQNYPNPFNPSTTVPFELNQPGEVVISLFNVFGQKIREFNLGPKNTGAYQHRIDLQYQASGVYFLRVKAGEHSQTIKISLIK